MKLAAGRADGPTDRQTDIVTYKAAIAAAKNHKLFHATSFILLEV